MPDDNDWRLHAFQEVIVGNGTTAADGRTSQQATAVAVDQIRLDKQRVLALPIPNATAMMLNTSRRAFQSAQRLLEKELLHSSPRGFVQFQTNADAIDFAECMATCVIAAYTSLECFANEWIPPWLTYRKDDPKGGDPRVLDKEAIERELKLRVKLDVVLPAVFNVKSPKGDTAWQGLVELERVRNRLIHMKHADRLSSEVGVDTIWKALVGIDKPYRTAKQLIDWFMLSMPRVSGLEYSELRPVRPHWHIAWRDDT